MQGRDVFLSVGGTANEFQEAFVLAVEDRLKAEGLNPRTVGRNTFSADAPLKTVTELINHCSGMVVIALERTYFPAGTEKRNGPKQKLLPETRLPTPWNQIEAAMAYSRGLPLLVIVEEGIKSEGLLEPSFEWYVQKVSLSTESLHTTEFNGVLSSWKEKVGRSRTQTTSDIGDVTQLKIGNLLAAMTPAQLWAVLVALVTILAATFTLGIKIAGT